MTTALLESAVCFVYLRPSQQVFSHVGTGLPGLNQYEQDIKFFAQGHISDSAIGEA